jgi:hypothetical protein
MKQLASLSAILFLANTAASAQSVGINGQTLNQVQTAVPFLNITPDSRAGAMGETGVATTPDVNSMYWNAAKYAFIDKVAAISFSYTPWLRKLVNDINLSYLTGYYKLDSRQTIAASLRYFSLGEITFTQTGASSDATLVRPNEFAVDFAYSRKLSEQLSGGIAFRYIRSDLTGGNYDPSQGETHAGTSFAADVSTYYTAPIKLEDKDANLSFGVNISNIGSRISYTDNNQKDFIPINLRIGSALKVNMDEYNTVGLSLDLNKLLVPTPPVYADSTNSSGTLAIISGMSPDVSVPKGMIQSFYDAPGGFKEEIQEIIWSVGAEWVYRQQFAIRGGYFHESESKGNRKYATVGAGLKLNVFDLDFAYLIPTSGQNNPLAGTVRFSLTFNFDSQKNK